MILICILLSIMLLLSPMSVYASELSDPVEVEPTFYGYQILGYDVEGNVILSNDDYVEYINRRLQIATFSTDFGDLVETKTRFIDLFSWRNIAWEFLKYMIENPTYTVESPTVPSEPSTSPTESPKGSYSYPIRLSSIGKKAIKYTKSGLTEIVTISVEATANDTNTVNPKPSIIYLTRSGAGASSTFSLWNHNFKSDSITFSAGSYVVGGTWSYYQENGKESSRICRIRMNGYSVNELPTAESSSTTMVANTAETLLGTSSKAADYAENTFMTNNYEYNINHYNIYNVNNYWAPLQYLAPILNTTTITTENYTQYTDYGYYLDGSGNLQLDTDILLAYLENEIMPKLELLYKNQYQDFPEPGATYGDTDIVYDNPFDDDTQAPSQPPDTIPGGGGTVIVEGGMTPSELYGVLETEEYYILDLETGLPAMQIDSLPEVEELPAEIVSAVSGVSDFVIGLFSQTGLLTIFMALAVLAFVVFAFHG